jgi:hypothetical protein
MSLCVFVGPTLSPDEGWVELEAAYLPPVSQGDVYRVSLQRPWGIGIIDGYFERVPAVWHKEILWAMSQGIHVFGSASMGALRAVELAPFGMVGVGEIFAAYRDGIFEADDEVAVAHGLAETGYRPLSEAMVNIRATLTAAEAAGILSPATHAALLQIGRDLYYPDRSYPRLLQLGAARGAPSEELSALRNWLPHGQIHQKRRDALQMLRVMREHRAAHPEPKHVAFTLERTGYWCELVAQAGETVAPLGW